MDFRKSSMNVFHILEVSFALLRTLTVALSSLVGGFTIRCTGDDNELWSYKGSRNGPSAWGETFADCYGRKQSPIDIELADVKKDPALKDLEFKNYDESVHSAEVINNGHTAKITPSDGVVRSITVYGDTYSLAQLHFHWGSRYDVGTEHLFDSKGYAMEAHFVHQNSQGGLAVVGVLYQEAHSNNTGFKAISDALSQIKFKGETTQLRSSLNLAKLLPRLPMRFYRYVGSLTTPGCSEGVIWSVAQDVIRIGSNQLHELRSLFTVTKDEDHAGCHLQDNYRPVQPLNERYVVLST
ncbi:hypothetical protein JTE90_004400 [Oedothorax gibbosus]|uniref:carbonic anhydrase n=1 Tax=Oedothorax gibbosus TaxID=931172 RepID=A0AAV6UQG6_9ARAC|nr:hypothetical protein JTE90_004400 [Oedothorax gibbosus]